MASGRRLDPVGHVPVLYSAVLTHLALGPGDHVIDATGGGGGHALGLLEATAPDGRVLGLDRDPEAVTRVRQRLASQSQRVTIVQGSFRELTAVARKHRFPPAGGALLDLGVSSYQLASPDRGFSFVKDGPLDMRLDPTQDSTAADYVNHLPTEELANLLYTFGDEKQSRRIARAIVAARPLQTTGELAQVIAQAVGGRRGRIHPATKSFQALRIAVNDELAALEEALPQAIELLRPGGRLAVISFHSLEDRTVKRFFRLESRDCICPPEQPVCTCQHRSALRIVTRRPVRPTEAEIAENPRARSARLRVAEKL
jgi:16S rRNA (cytosine1402-N4)-methyltransferase